MRETMK